MGAVLTAPLIGETGYMRVADDAYDTPEWVTLALLQHWTPPLGWIWEPAAGKGNIIDVLDRELSPNAYVTFGSDVAPRRADIERHDFLTCQWFSGGPLSIITNPPFEDSDDFVARALHWLDRMQEANEKASVALLLPTEWDHAPDGDRRGSGRRSAFLAHPAYAMQIKLQRRIRWIEGSTTQPRKNHTWFVWDTRHRDDPVIRYAK